MTRYWLSFQLRSDLAEFEYQGPWWISGYGGENCDEPCVCLAIIEASAEDAVNSVLKFFDEPPEIAEWRFVTECEDDWEPFRDRFPSADWMVWPITVEQALADRHGP